MIYQRGHPANYNDWAALGNEGWDWEDVLPYFIKSENQQRMQSELHGLDGPLQVSDLSEPHFLSKTFIESAKAADYPQNDDFNDGIQEGFGLYQVTQKDDKRLSAAVAYLHPALKRPNLTAIPFAHVLHLTFEGTRCTGAVYRKDNQEYEVQARYEVIVCGGAINSPQLLLLSGIGDKVALTKLDIPLIKDLPGVGQNLQDHLNLPVVYECLQSTPFKTVSGETKSSNSPTEPKVMLSSNRAEAGGFVSLSEDSSAPEIQFHFVAPWGSQDEPSPEEISIILYPGISEIKSTGSISLCSKNPDDAPIIDPRYLSNEADVLALIESVKIARKIVATAPFDPYRGIETLPGEAVQTDEELREFVKENAGTIYHPIGTCKMGNDPMSVVNDRLQVHGVQGLRVADASIMPFIVNANTNAPCIMIGEKVADMIKTSLG